MKLIKKKRAKGFTLVELIVVMAIIGVLAAVLIPSMLGFMRDSRISRANQNATTVFTAAQPVLTKYAISNGTTGLGSATFTGAYSAASGDIIASNGGSPAITLDLTDYLGGANFRGNFLFVVNGTGDTIEYALWSEQVSPLAVGNRPANVSAQESAYGVNSLVGAHPAP